MSTAANSCIACGHEHQGAKHAYICIGCPCPERPGQSEEVEDPEDDAYACLAHGIPDCAECAAGHAVEDEIDDVLVFLRRHERDQIIGITPPPLADIITALERGEHRR